MAACNSCGAPIRFAKVESSGRRMPFDDEPVPYAPRGVYAVLGSTAYTHDEAVALVSERQGVSEQRARAILDENDDWLMSHFATCPNADTHRRA